MSSKRTGRKYVSPGVPQPKDKYELISGRSSWRFVNLNPAMNKFAELLRRKPEEGRQQAHEELVKHIDQTNERPDIELFDVRFRAL